MTEVAAWLWLPLVFYAVAVGSGLLVERLFRVRLPNALLGPIGLAVIVVAVTPVYRLGGNAHMAAPLVILAAAAGALLAGRSLKSRLQPGWTAFAAGAGAYVLYLAPVALSGHWSWAGYEFVNDTAANLIFTEHVAGTGVVAPHSLNSTTAAIAATPIELNYPLAAHFLVATVRQLSWAPLAAAFQPAMAAIAGLAAMSFAELLRRVGLPSALAALAAVLAVASNLLYRYVMHGAVKEILVVALLATAAAVGAELLARRASLRAIALLLLIVAPLPAVFSATGALYGVALALPFVIILLWRARPRPRRVAAGAALVLAVGAVAAGPTLVDTVTFGWQASHTFASEGGQSTAFMGQLARPLPLTQAAGVWLGRDYRVPVTGDASLPNGILIGLAVALFLIGVISQLRRRSVAPLALLVATGLIGALLAIRLSPYADAKLLVIVSPPVALLAAIGAHALGRGGTLRVTLATAVGAAVGVGVLWSAAVAYREVRLAPPARMLAMQDVAEHAGRGRLWLVNEWEEYAKYFMRRIRVNMPFEVESPRPAQLRDRGAPIFGRYYDLDRLTLRYVMSFSGIVRRRSPSASRPPAAFEKVYENRYYELWRRRSGIRVAEHLPLQRLHDATVEPDCGAVRRMASRTRPGERLVAALPPSVTLFDTARHRRPGWVLNQRPDPADTVTPLVPGRVAGNVRTARGRFHVWVRGTFGRAVTAYVDGGRIGTADEVNTPGQWLEVGIARLRGGAHRVELRRPSTSLAPGDGYRGLIGPVALQRAGEARLVTVRAVHARSLCGRQWDWIERVSGKLQ